ncbi:M10 family metallopeptidase [Gemmobacter denitrificans]|uniref:M10 family metallopeptidase n=1 Tax=Gemmobacter denitrificans TaxID=3123040 RepID=A0ABU8BVQ1_9RHOB
MCTLCSALNPTDLAAGSDLHLGNAPNAKLSSFTLDQIADQLTEGYWTFNEEAPNRSFDVAPGGTLTVDFGDLGADERYLARAALEAWTDVTGIIFEEFVEPDLTDVFEIGDAGEGTTTAARMTVGQAYHGELTSDTDTDWVAVRLEAGKTYTVALAGEGDSFEALEDPRLFLYDAQGRLVAENDDFQGGLNSLLTFTATTTGTYYVRAAAYQDDFGAYVMGVAEGAMTPPQITFTNSEELDGAYATSELDGNTILSSAINIGTEFNSEPFSLNSYWFETYIHEIGHALGLGHAGNYNGSAVFSRDAHYANDSVLNTIMSYFDQDTNPNFDADYGYVSTLMPADIIAIQNLYGSNVQTRTGDTVYGANSNVTGYLGDLFGAMFDGDAAAARIWQDSNMAFTLFDTGGHDTVDMSTVRARQTISLTAGELSSVGGFKLNMAIARGTVIEDAIGGSGADRITGNNVGNQLVGKAGNDRLIGGGGADTLIGGVGNDRMIGGTGRDAVSYAEARNAIRVDLNRTTAQDTRQGRDTLTGIEDVIGSRFGDRITGSNRANDLDGRAGNDTLAGGRGDDVLAGGAGADTFRFNAGADRITDFAAGQDQIGFDDALWGGGRRSGERILEAAEVVGDAVVFTFGQGNSLTLEGISSLAGLADNLFSY